MTLLSNSYDRIAEQWHSNARGDGYVEHVLRYVDLILEGVARGSRVLDLGCGTGTPIAKYIAQSGFQVVGIDQSEKMLEFARREVPQVEFIHADMVDFQIAEKFAAIVAWDSAFHVERKHHAALYRKLADSLVSGGRLLLSVGGEDVTDPASEAEGFTSEMFGETFFYSGFAPDVARELLEDAGFEIEVWELDDPTSHGHIAVIARKSPQLEG